MCSRYERIRLLTIFQLLKSNTFHNVNGRRFSVSTFSMLVSVLAYYITLTYNIAATVSTIRTLSPEAENQMCVLDTL